jgi:hypothetical protein
VWKVGRYSNWEKAEEIWGILGIFEEEKMMIGGGMDFVHWPTMGFEPIWGDGARRDFKLFLPSFAHFGGRKCEI